MDSEISGPTGIIVDYADHSFKFFTIDQILMGALNGRRGQLLIDDFTDLSPIQMDFLLTAQTKLLWNMRYLKPTGKNE